jgi:hypothetical protein
MIRQLWPLLAGFGLWSIAFVGLYGLQYLGCYFAWYPATHRVLLVAAYAATIAALLVLLLVQFAHVRRRGGAATRLDRIGLGATGVALFAALVTFAPAVFVSACL